MNETTPNNTCELCKTLLGRKDNPLLNPDVREAEYFSECLGCKKLYQLGVSCANEGCKEAEHRHVCGLSDAQKKGRIV